MRPQTRCRPSDAEPEPDLPGSAIEGGFACDRSPSRPAPGRRACGTTRARPAWRACRRGFASSSADRFWSTRHPRSASWRRAIRRPTTCRPGTSRRRALVPAGGGSTCEWKGPAVYYDVVLGGSRAPRAAWAYLAPWAPFERLAHHVAFYAAAMEACFVGEERAEPQPGGFYGGWVTQEGGRAVQGRAWIRGVGRTRAGPNRDDLCRADDSGWHGRLRASANIPVRTVGPLRLR